MQYLKKSKISNSFAQEELSIEVKNIIDKVKIDNDEALINYNITFDNCNRNNLRISQQEIQEAYNSVSEQLISSIKIALNNIEKFARKQRESLSDINDYEITEGVFLGQRVIPVDSCACYVPGGTYPLYSSALMLIAPAKIAGVKRIVACSPMMKNTNKIHPATLVAMDLAGVDEIYAVGGAQAIAALTYGTKQINPVNMIVGPGNQYVTEAKRQCYGLIGIDFLAGPSEVLIIADKSARADFIAADLLAQSEHDYQARGILITDDKKLANNVIIELDKQLAILATKEIANQAWLDNGEVIVVSDLNKACELANEYAPEHLEIQVEDSNKYIYKLNNYGSLFIGGNAAEVFGDYVAGTNHTLPTLQAAKYTGGVSVLTFLKVCTNQYLNPNGVINLAKTAGILADNEELAGHAKAARIRLEQ